MMRGLRVVLYPSSSVMPLQVSGIPAIKFECGKCKEEIPDRSSSWWCHYSEGTRESQPFGNMRRLISVLAGAE